MRALRPAAAVLALGLAGCSIPRWPVDAPVASHFGARREEGLLPRPAPAEGGADLPAPGLLRAA